MRLLMSLALCLVVLQVTAQKQFRGTISYRVTSVEDLEEPNIVIAISFAPAGIRIRFSGDGPKGNEDVLIRFDSAAIFTLAGNDKNYTMKPLNLKSVPTTAPRDILGLRTNSIEFNPSEHYFPLGALGKAVLHFGDDLYYRLPDELGDNASLFFIRDGHIALGLDVAKADDGPQRSGDSMPGVALRVEAFEIDSLPPPADFLNIPADFVRKNSRFELTDEMGDAHYMDSLTEAVDSVASLIDSSVTIPEKQPVRRQQSSVQPAKKKTAPVKKKTPSGEKKTASPSPARKPE